MRIAFIIPYFYPALEYGGTPRVAYDLARALANRGHSLSILTTDTGGAERLERSRPIEGLRGLHVVHYANISNYLGFRQRVFLPLGFFRDVHRQLKNVEIAHIHDLRSFLSVGAHWALRSLHIPYVLSPHGGLQHLGKKSAKVVFDKLWGKRILRDASAICAVSPSEEQDALEFGTRGGRIARLPSAINAAVFEELPERRAETSVRTILFLGRLNWIKSVDVLINAFSAICRSLSVKLVIAGPDDGAESALRALVKQLKLEEFVRFTGFLDVRAKIRALVDADIVVLPSSHEGFPVTVLEALACRRPIIVSSACQVGDWISAAGAPESLVTFQAGDVKDLAQRITELLCASIPRTILDQRRSVILRQFSTEAVAATADRLYASIIAGAYGS